MSALIDMGAAASAGKAAPRNPSVKSEPSCLHGGQDEGAALFSPSPKGTPPHQFKGAA